MPERLLHVDRELGERRSLHPGRARASTLGELAALLLADGDPPALKAAFARGLGAVARAIARNFPDNIFWDLDFLAAGLVASGRRALSELDQATELLVDVQVRYGADSPIRFRYVHDFLYGYDWARWVARAPLERQHIGPYDLAFLERMGQRAAELRDLIEAGDRTLTGSCASRARASWG
jgi:hypothetical protein